MGACMEHRLRRLEEHAIGREGSVLKLSLPVPTSASGKVVRKCPADSCTPGLFMLGAPTTYRVISTAARCAPSRTVGSDPWNCPYCGQEGVLETFMPQEDVDAVVDYVGALARDDIVDQVQSMLAKTFGKNSAKSGFSISFKPNRRPSVRPRLPVRHDLLRNLRCDSCGCSYGVFAIGLFCPDCGAPNLGVHFKREMELVELQIALAQEAESEYGEEASYRLMGNSHEDTLGVAPL